MMGRFAFLLAKIYTLYRKTLWKINEKAPRCHLFHKVSIIQISLQDL